MSEAVDYMDQDSFHVTDDASAEWCLKKIREAKENCRMWKAHYEAQMKKVADESEQTISYMQAKLEEYFATVPHKVTKTQESYSLPGGKLMMKKQQPEYKVNDEVLVPWLENNFMDHLIKVKKTADWANLNKVVNSIPGNDYVSTDDGEIVPGVTVTERPDVFKIEMED